MKRYKMTVEFRCSENKKNVEELLKQDLEGAMEYYVDLSRVTVDSIDIVEKETDIICACS